MDGYSSVGYCRKKRASVGKGDQTPTSPLNNPCFLSASSLISAAGTRDELICARSDRPGPLWNVNQDSWYVVVMPLPCQLSQ